MEERKKRLEGRRKQRKEERRNAYYCQKEEEAQRIREEQLKKGNDYISVCGGTEASQVTILGGSRGPFLSMLHAPPKILKFCFFNSSKLSILFGRKIQHPTF